MNDSELITEHSGRKLKDQKYRKQDSPAYSNTEPKLQKTISELFSTSKKKSRSQEARDLDHLSTKRLKREHPTSELSQIQAPNKAVQADDMYKLSSTMLTGSGANDKIRTSEIVDLTISPPDSPVESLQPHSKPRGLISSEKSASYTGPKRLVVKNFREHPRAEPNQYFDKVWKQLDGALSAIFRNEMISYSLEELYRGVETLCRQDRAPYLYKKLCEKCKQEISIIVKEPLIKRADGMEEIAVLRAVVEAWLSWSSQMATVRRIFFYLDRAYLLHLASQASIENMGISEFRSHIFSNVALKPKIIQGACDLLSASRQGNREHEDNNLFRQAIQLFHTLSVYGKEFEPRMMADSERFFLTWAEEKSTTQCLAKYVKECQELIDVEARRCDLLDLDSTTRINIEKYIEDILVENRIERLLKTEDVSALLERHDVHALKQLYDLLQRRQLGEKLGVPFEAFIIQYGSTIVFDEKREHEMVVRLLEFKRKLDYVWEHSFQMHETLGHTLREAFESFINTTKRSSMTWGTDNPKPGEMIAKYVDMILRGGTKAIPKELSSDCDPNAAPQARDLDDSGEDEDVEITKQLDQVLDLFRFVHGKAVFEAFYKRDLARRLLLGRSSSSNAEKSMLTRLKSECGAGFTHNLEQMFKDIELAREEITSYKSMLDETQTRPSVDLNVNVLSASAWPTYPDIALQLPKNIQRATGRFENYYKSKHSGRRLVWKHALAHCQLKAKYPKGDKEIVVSSFQAIVLLHFNEKQDSESVSYAELQEASNLDDTELKRTLQSLACAKYRVLNKTPRGREVDATDSFTVNLGFSDPKYRIKINQIQAKETKKENKETHERVVLDRNYETQAAIVRIMKTRKTITHAELVSEVIIATKNRGPLDPSDIKKNIEKLIEKDYMEREDNDAGRNIYCYLA